LATTLAEGTAAPEASVTNPLIPAIGPWPNPNSASSKNIAVPQSADVNFMQPPYATFPCLPVILRSSVDPV
jgi:hypothetical protein